VRIVPRSRRVPWFNLEELERSMPARGLAYLHLPTLGGWRRPRPDSPNGGWRTPAFQGYADHMLTPAFRADFGRLTEEASARPTAVMCAEAAWWRCHRRLIADRVVARGGRACHIGPDGRIAPHELPSFAQVRAGELLYPPPEPASPAP
jgi:uncharacterized protein (DUF488 family)